MKALVKRSLVTCEVLWVSVVAIASWNLLRDSNMSLYPTLTENRATLFANFIIAVVPIILIELYRRTDVLGGVRSAALGWLVLGLVIVAVWRGFALALGYVYLYVLMPFGLFLLWQSDLTATVMAVIGILLLFCFLHTVAASIGRLLIGLRVHAK